MENQDPSINSASKPVDEAGQAGKRIIEAIENSELLLLYQLIDPLKINSSESRHYEVFIRLIEEEDNLVPPGAFFPIAEQHGLMPSLDRWVVKDVLGWSSGTHLNGIMDEGSMFFINLAGATIRDPEFPGFVEKSLQEFDMPGATLCFEIPGGDLTLSVAEIARFAKATREIGCSVAISGFGQGMTLFGRISGIQVDFLKIDGSIILSMRREPGNLAKALAISQVARKIGVKTIAEFVEDEETIIKLSEIGVDFIQGFGVSRPIALECQ